MMEVFMPKTIEELLPNIDNKNRRITAGCTDIVVALRNNRISFKPAIDITHIGELKEIFEQEEKVYIGSNVPLSDICESEIIKNNYRILVEAIETIGSPQIRNIATLAGNVQNASPSGDGILALVLLGASLILRSTGGRREIAAQDFIIGPGKTLLNNDEFIEYIVLDKKYQEYNSYFEKVGLRSAMVISVASMGVLLKAEEGVIKDIRIAYGAVAPKVLRLIEAENHLKERYLDEEALIEAGEIVVRTVCPIDDLRASAGYRRAVCKNLILRLLELKKEG
jgi:xanthine dehydrogenase FAD-binding subunit